MLLSAAALKTLEQRSDRIRGQGFGLLSELAVNRPTADEQGSCAGRGVRTAVGRDYSGLGRRQQKRMALEQGRDQGLGSLQNLLHRKLMAAACGNSYTPPTSLHFLPLGGDPCS